MLKCFRKARTAIYLRACAKKVTWHFHTYVGLSRFRIRPRKQRSVQVESTFITDIDQFKSNYQYYYNETIEIILNTVHCGSMVLSTIYSILPKFSYGQGRAGSVDCLRFSTQIGLPVGTWKFVNPGPGLLFFITNYICCDLLTHS